MYVELQIWIRPFQGQREGFGLIQKNELYAFGVFLTSRYAEALQAGGGSDTNFQHHDQLSPQS